MRDWRVELEKMVRFGGAIPEPLCDCFEVQPPSGSGWPDGLPSCPALRDFYRLCDGGRLGDFSFLRLGEVKTTTEETREWIDRRGGEDDLTPGRWAQWGYDEFGEYLLWDEARCQLFLYDSDGGGTEEVGGPVERFLERLFNPPEPKTELSVDEPLESGEGQDLWFVTLRELDRIAGAA